MSRALVSYVSIHHGNTQKVAAAMAETLGADLMPVKEAGAGTIEQYDLIGFGSGVYFGRLHRSLLDLVDALPMMRGRSAFLFSTSGLRRVRLVHDFSRPLKTRLQRKGFAIVGEFSCRGYDTFGAAMLVGGIRKGHPSAKDLERAEEFARALRDRWDQALTVAGSGAPHL